MRTLTLIAITTGALVSVVAWQAPRAAMFGFTADGAGRQRALERQFLRLPSADRIRDAHRLLADQPHMAGTARDRELADWTRDRFSEYGLEHVEVTTHDVLLPWPEEVVVELTAPRRWRASMREDPVPGDRYTQISPEAAGLPYHAYSASGDVTAPVVYAGSGNPADYDRLAASGVDVRGRIVIVRYSVPYSYRGFKALTAQQRGAAGILIYSDAADDGAGKGRVYPDGPWGPESHIQRGGIVYDFMVPGDPLTPGWASLPGAKRVERSEAISLPKIISAPLSHRDARVILDVLDAKGQGSAVVRLRVRMDDRVRPIWTVTGTIRGSERPEDLVIVGNHRDAWIYGGVDPSSGSAALMELARTLGHLTRTGWRPKRSIVFASWDAEEFTLTSSTEWGEQHAAHLRKHAVAYLNVDSAASGRKLAVTAVPVMNRLIAEAAQVVRDPLARIPLAAVTRARHAEERSILPSASGDTLVRNRLGSGSDYTVFLNHLGVPVADLSFDGPYGVYHSIYDNHNWVARIGDPGFRYHAALVQLWGVITLRLAQSDVLPFEYSIYAAEIAGYVRELEEKSAGTSLREIREAVEQLAAAAAVFDTRRDAAIAANTRDQFEPLDRRLMAAERAFLEDDGIPGRPWYRHQVYAPKFTYAPEVLPAVAEALAANDKNAVAAQAKRVAATIRRAAAALQ